MELGQIGDVFSSSLEWRGSRDEWKVWKMMSAGKSSIKMNSCFILSAAEVSFAIEFVGTPRSKAIQMGSSAALVVVRNFKATDVSSR